MERRIELVIIVIGGSIAEGFILKALLDLIPNGLSKFILETGFLIAGLIGVPYLAYRIYSMPRELSDFVTRLLYG